MDWLGTGMVGFVHVEFREVSGELVLFSAEVVKPPVLKRLSLPVLHVDVRLNVVGKGGLEDVVKVMFAPPVVD